MADVMLEEKVDKQSGIKGYAMHYRGQIVPMTNDVGQIFWDEAKTEWLAWDMVGDPGGSMRVQVLRGETLISVRKSSKLPMSKGAGFDEIPIPQVPAPGAAK